MTRSPLEEVTRIPRHQTTVGDEVLHWLLTGTRRVWHYLGTWLIPEAPRVGGGGSWSTYRMDTPR